MLGKIGGKSLTLQSSYSLARAYLEIRLEKSSVELKSLNMEERIKLTELFFQP